MKPAMYTNVTAEKTSTNNDQEKQISEDFLQWKIQDRLLSGWIIVTLTEETLVIGLDSSQSIWNPLNEAYAQVNT